MFVFNNNELHYISFILYNRCTVHNIQMNNWINRDVEICNVTHIC